MSQVDILNFFSIIFWFSSFFILFYFLNYSYVLPIIYTSLLLKYNKFLLILSNVKTKYNAFITVSDDVLKYIYIFNNFSFIKYNYNYYSFIYKWIIYSL